MNMNRRQFVKRSVCTASLAAVPLLAHGEKKISTKNDIIDAHSHIWTTDLKSYPLQGRQTVDDLKPRSFTPDELMAVASPHGVTKVVLIQHNIYHGPDNSYITDTIQKEPEKYSGVAKVNAQGADPVAEMIRLSKVGIRGLRILPTDGGKTTPWRESEGMNGLWKNAPKAGVAMCPLINPQDLAEVKYMCEKNPETTVVIDHFARIGIDGNVDPNDLKNLVEIAKFPNTNVKVSAYYALGKKKPPHTELNPMIKALYESYGPKRLMWASDCPYQLGGPNTYGDSIALIKDRIDFLSEADKRDILFNTAERVFFA